MKEDLKTARSVYRIPEIPHNIGIWQSLTISCFAASETIGQRNC